MRRCSPAGQRPRDRKSTRLNSSHGYISYAVFCLKKKWLIEGLIARPVRRSIGIQQLGTVRFTSAPHCLLFFFNDTPSTDIYPLSLHDSLPISCAAPTSAASRCATTAIASSASSRWATSRSEEHTSELQSRLHFVCRLLL